MHIHLNGETSFLALGMGKKAVQQWGREKLGTEECWKL